MLVTLFPVSKHLTLLAQKNIYSSLSRLDDKLSFINLTKKHIALIARKEIGVRGQSEKFFFF